MEIIKHFYHNSPNTLSIIMSPELLFWVSAMNKEQCQNNLTILADNSMTMGRMGLN
ncbi:hypothetical protein FACS1894152_4050 [Bacilli bacterium]|nr:hypothetical protein FACS1894152_4050 [Bacilli bacterium]